MAIPSAPATSPAMAAGRGSPNPMPAGLSALLKPDATPRGMPSGSIQQIMNTARKMSDSQLADVLSGKSIDVPQYVAMTEAMGRKKLRTAMQGAQAQAQMQQPSVKDKLLAEEAVSPMMGQPMPGQMPVMAAEGGLASLPAPNMDSVDMADGGIIAFNGEDNEQIVKDKDKEGRNFFERLRDSLYTPSETYLSDIMRGKKATPPAGPQISAANIDAMRQGKTPPVVPQTPEQLRELQRESTRGIRAPLANLPVAAAPTAAPAAAPAAAPSAAASQTGGMSGLQSYLDAIKANQQDYYSKLEGMGAKAREGIAQLRRQGGGEALMNLAQGILSKPGLAAGIAAGLPGVTQTAAASRKEQRAVEGLANEYDFNLAKARAADAKGNTEAALKYMQLADEAKYRAGDLQYKMGALNQGTDAMRNAQFLAKNPEMARFFPSVGKTDIIGREKALEQFNKLSKSRQKEFGDFENYFRMVNNQGLYATLPGQGADVIGTLK
jgi:hypothetical protein